MMGIWINIRLYAALAAAVAAGVGIAFLRGVAAGRAREATLRASARVRHMRQAMEIKYNAENSSRADLERRAGKWMRDE